MGNGKNLALVLFVLTTTLILGSAIDAYAGGSTPAENGSGELEGCLNDKTGFSAPCDTADEWAKSNIAPHTSYTLGDSIPVRVDITLDTDELGAGFTHLLQVSWDITKQDNDLNHTFDFITSFDVNDDPHPCLVAHTGINDSPCDLWGSDTEPIPVPTENTLLGTTGSSQPETAFGAFNTPERQFTMFADPAGGGTIEILDVSYSFEGDPEVDDTTVLSVTFTTTSSHVVAAFGAHLASNLDWTNTATNVSGQPYQVDCVGVNGGGCNAHFNIAAAGLEEADVCGDGEKTGDEFCDDGANNGKVGFCNDLCTALEPDVCGDGEKTGGEFCDDGELNGTIGFCNDLCTALEPDVCGDGEKTGDEFCDDGELNGTIGFCNDLCTGLEADVCGDGEKTGGEFCDDGANNGKVGFCNDLCTGLEADVCGDGEKTGGEFCDDGELNGTIGFCNDLCTALEPDVCGDGEITGSEFCDDGELNGTPGFCNAACTGIEPDSGDGGDNAWDTRPTFGVNHETREEIIVENGFRFNDESFTITDNHWTAFDQQIIQIGTTNSFTATVYASQGLKVQEFLFSVPDVGMGHLAEMRVEVWFDNAGEIDEIKALQNTDVIDRTTLSITHQKVKCLEADIEENCDSTSMSAVFLEPLLYDVMAVKAMDWKLRDQTTYLNEGFDISGDSLNPMATKMIPSTVRYEGLIEVTQNEKYSDNWTSDDGRIFEMNSFGSFKQINYEFKRFQDTGDPRNRLHSAFASLIEYEQERAKLVFDASELIRGCNFRACR